MLGKPMPAWKGKDDKVLFTWNDNRQLIDKVKSWSITPTADTVEEDWHDQDRTDTTLVLKYYEVSVEGSQVGLEIVQLWFDNQFNEDAHEMPFDGWIAMKVKKGNGTQIAVAFAGVTIMPFKMDSPGRAALNTFTLPLRAKYMRLMTV